jgi:hypothetical protein
MPQALAAVVAFATTVGAALGFAGTVATVVGAVVIASATYAASRMISGLYEMPQMDTDASRQRTVKSTVEPMKIIYGESLSVRRFVIYRRSW